MTGAPKKGSNTIPPTETRPHSNLGAKAQNLGLVAGNL